MQKIRVLFVCLGNICRSPLGEGVFRHLVKMNGASDFFEIDSAGTSDYHVGERPHTGSISIAEKHGISIVDQRGRQFTQDDIDRWDYIIVMDESNEKDLIRDFNDVETKIHRLRDFDPKGPGDVPDPWGRGDDAFQEVYDIVHRSCEALIDYILRENDEIRD